MPMIIQGVPCDHQIKKIFSPVYQRQITQLTCILPGGGCVYYRANKGDVCPFCAFPAATRELIKGPGHEHSFESWTLGTETYQQMYKALTSEAEDAEKIAIFNGGSFFPNSELPDEFQHYVYEDIAARPTVKQLMVESCPSFIAEKKLLQAKEILGSTDLMVGIGFESQDDYVRNTLLKKGVDKNLFEKKVNMMQRLGIQVFVYAFLKAPGLTEKEALEETLKTIQYLHNLGVDEIALSCAFVPPGTYLEEKYKKGEFRPPWLWTILKIMETAQKNNWPLSVGGFEDYPPPVAIPNNCPECDDNLYGLFDHYRQQGKVPSDTDYRCSCHTIWNNNFCS